MYPSTPLCCICCWQALIAGLSLTTDDSSHEHKRLESCKLSWQGGQARKKQALHLGHKAFQKPKGLELFSDLEKSSGSLLSPRALS